LNLVGYFVQITNMTHLTHSKVVFIGNGGCGKTSYIHKVRTGEFKEEYKPTLGVEVNPIEIPSGWNYFTYNCWDCSGQERFGGLQERYYKGANVIVVCFSMDSKLDINSIPGWIKLAMSTNPDVPIILMSTKSDLKCPDFNVLHKVFEKYDFPYCATSAKIIDGNLHQLFDIICEII
jgi:GTP-binding nuclear protein Ran